MKFLGNSSVVASAGLISYSTGSGDTLLIDNYTPSAPGAVGLALRAHNTQTADLTQWRNHNQIVTAKFNSSAAFTTYGTTTTHVGLTTPTNIGFTTSTTGGTLAPGTYYYRVSAVNAAGETVASAEASRVVSAGTSTNVVTVNWDAVPGVTSYKVYGRSIGAELLIATVTNTTYSDTGSVTPSGALPSNPTGTKLVVQGWQNQSGNLQEWQNSSGSVLASIGGSGIPTFTVGGTFGSTLNVNTDVATNKGLIVKGFASQLANLTEWQDSSNNIIASVGAYGSFATTLQDPTKTGLTVQSSTGNTKTISNVALTSNVATITTSVTHGFVTGGSVVISGLTNSALNGTYIIASTPSGTTFTYAKVTGNISSVTDSGTAVAAQNANPLDIKDSGGTSRVFISPNFSYVANASDLYYLGFKPGSREYRIGTYDGGGVFVFSRSDITTNSCTVAINTSDVTFSTSSGSSSLIYVASGGKVIFTPSSAGGAGQIQFGRRNSDSSTSVGASSEFWPITSQSTPVLCSVIPGGGTYVFKVMVNGDTYTTLQDPTKVGLTIQGTAANTKSINNVALTSNVATITTSAAHGFPVGGSAVITGLTNSVLNGTWTIASAPSTTTFTFAKTNANITSVADSGTVVVSQTGNLQEWYNGAGTLVGSLSPAGVLLLGSNGTNQGLKIITSTTNNVYFMTGGGGQYSTLVPGALQDSGLKSIFTSGSWNLGSARIISWGTTDNYNATQVVGIGRSADAILEVNNGTLGSLASLRIGTQSASTQPLIVKGFASQSVNLTEWQNNSNTPLSVIDKDGYGFPDKATFLLGGGGTVATGTDVGSFYYIVPRNGKVVKAFMSAKTAPTGAALIVDLLRSTDGGSSFTSFWNSTPANRVQLAASSKTGTQTSFDNTVVTEGDLLRVDVIQVGSTVAGSGVNVVLLMLLKNQ